MQNDPLGCINLKVQCEYILVKQKRQQVCLIHDTMTVESNLKTKNLKTRNVVRFMKEGGRGDNGPEMRDGNTHTQTHKYNFSSSLHLPNQFQIITFSTLSILTSLLSSRSLSSSPSSSIRSGGGDSADKGFSCIREGGGRERGGEVTEEMGEACSHM